MDRAYQVLREFETITTTRFCSFYTKYFGKRHDQGIGKDQVEIQHFLKVSLCIEPHKELSRIERDSPKRIQSYALTLKLGF